MIGTGQSRLEPWVADIAVGAWIAPRLGRSGDGWVRSHAAVIPSTPDGTSLEPLLHSGLAA